MNYQHIYHAGNFSEVVKHVVLVQLLNNFLKKDAGFCVIDTHAGAGLYDLTSRQAQKTEEYLSGIALLLQHPNAAPAWLQDYISIILPYYQQGESHYPGSPLITRELLREQDKLIANEKLPISYDELRQCFRHDEQVALHHRDAYEFLPAVLPPKDYGRGLVFIDPPYEKTDEREKIVDVLQESMQRFAHGMYAIWYPLTDKEPRFYPNKKLQKLFVPEKTLWFEFAVHNEDVPGLIGCAMVIINFPWQFDTLLEKILADLWQRLSPEQEGFYRVKLF